MDRHGSLATINSQSVLRMKDASSFSFKGPGGFPIGAAGLRSATGGAGLTDANLPEGAVMISVQMIDHEGYVLLNHHAPVARKVHAHHWAMFDYRMNWRANLRPALCMPELAR